ncbi:hypothetical protein CDL15_Pgr004938 [Punica granatum]|uniref:Uncharacterized protein n=1 Tax=Punica granatum TaxID=22663 RepID=A0A218WVT3_PUNGR|nr:hypothetical protein CDL15_Pgr004938 [Punica granatum]PKI70241.1 hypothetical protein CRG98_009373 [Punica granatum]
MAKTMARGHDFIGAAGTGVRTNRSVEEEEMAATEVGSSHHFWGSGRDGKMSTKEERKEIREESGDFHSEMSLDSNRKVVEREDRVIAGLIERVESRES